MSLKGLDDSKCLGFIPVSHYFPAVGKERMMNLFSALDLVFQSTEEDEISHAMYEAPLILPLYYGHTDSERLLAFSSQTPHCISVQPSYKFRIEKTTYLEVATF